MFEFYWLIFNFRPESLFLCDNMPTMYIINVQLIFRMEKIGSRIDNNLYSCLYFPSAILIHSRSQTVLPTFEKSTIDIEAVPIPIHSSSVSTHK